MSILCLICKEKLVSYSPGGSSGSLNRLVENVIIATSCGHLYHAECLQSWFRTQRIKKQNSPENENSNNNICPSCLTRVSEEDNRRIFLFEDHLEALEKAKFLEKQENLEIYVHQLENQVQQLHRENDIMLNKILTPPQSPEEYDTIVKNDRVVWMRKNEPPLNGIVLSIFKKEGKLCARIKLDRKVKPNQRTSKIFGSFRLEKKQEVTVPFDEIVLEKDVNKNATSRTDKNSSNHFAPTTSPFSSNSYQAFSLNGSVDNFRTSTLSLPDDSSRRHLNQIKEAVDEAEIVETSHLHLHNQPVPIQRPNLNRSVSYSAGFHYQFQRNSIQLLSTHAEAPESRRESVTSIQSVESSAGSLLDQQRDYVMITPSWMKTKSRTQITHVKSLDRSSPPDSKNKHVTFADDHGVDTNEGFMNVLQSPYANLPSSNLDSATVSTPPKPKKRPPPLPPLDLLSGPPPPRPRTRNSIADSEYNSSGQSTPLPTTPQDLNSAPKFHLSVYETITRSNIPAAELDFEDLRLLQEFDDVDPEAPHVPGAFEDANCFDVTLLSLLYRSYGFDEPMLKERVEDSDFARAVKWIIREKFVAPLRKYGTVQNDCNVRLKEALTHLCSGVLDVEELLTILFEFTYKIPPFINYSMEMCDYLHQFFIDFTDKTKIRSVQYLFEKSLKLQDNLQLENGPEPALILQMPHSDGKIIHYNAVIPNLTMKIDHILEGHTTKQSLTVCYCENEATLECRICTEKHGTSAVLFCENCKPLLEGIHKENDHELEVAAISPTPFENSTSVLALSAIICWKNRSYSVFLKDGREIYSPWTYIHGIQNGKLQSKSLPGFGYWLESLLDSSKSLEITDIPPLLKKALQNSRTFIYLPLNSSEV